MCEKISLLAFTQCLLYKGQCGVVYVDPEVLSIKKHGVNMIHIARPLIKHLHSLDTSFMLVMILMYFFVLSCVYHFKDFVTMCVESNLPSFKTLGISLVLRLESDLSSPRFCLLLANDDFLIQCGGVGRERLLNIY